MLSSDLRILFSTNFFTKIILVYCCLSQILYYNFASCFKWLLSIHAYVFICRVTFWSRHMNINLLFSVFISRQPIFLTFNSFLYFSLNIIIVFNTKFLKLDQFVFKYKTEWGEKWFLFSWAPLTKQVLIRIPTLSKGPKWVWPFHNSKKKVTQHIYGGAGGEDV
jgi:hypothetical protein